jgi:hypothetical protein
VKTFSQPAASKAIRDALSVNLDEIVDTHLINWPAFKFLQLNLILGPFLVATIGAAVITSALIDVFFFGATNAVLIFRSLPYQPFQADALFRLFHSTDRFSPINWASDNVIRETLANLVRLFLAAQVLWLRSTKISIALLIILICAYVYAEVPYVQQLLSEIARLYQSTNRDFSDVETITTAYRSVLWSMNLGIGGFCYFLVAKSLFTNASLTVDERLIRSECFKRSSSARPILKSLGIGENIRNATRKGRTAAISYLGVLTSWTPFMMLSTTSCLVIFVVTTPLILSRSWGSQAFPLVAALGVLSLVVLCACFYVVLKTVDSAGKWAVHKSRRYLTVSLEKARSKDGRAPILFLRSFKSEHETLPEPAGQLTYAFFSYAERNKTVDEMLLEEGSGFGPVIAIGKPNEAVSPYGAARTYVDASIWQERVAQLAKDSQAIIVYVDNSEGLWWEIEHIIEKGYSAKSLFMLHYKCSAVSEGNEILNRLCGTIGVGLPGLIELNELVGLWITDEGKTKVGLASESSRVHYTMLLRSFMRLKLGQNGGYRK